MKYIDYKSGFVNLMQDSKKLLEEMFGNGNNKEKNKSLTNNNSHIPKNQKEFGHKKE